MAISRCSVFLIILVGVVAFTAQVYVLPNWRYIVYFGKTLTVMQTLGETKRVQHVIIDTATKYGGDNPTFKAPENGKIMWGYWHSAADMPPVIDVTLASWKVRNPGWQIIVLTLENLAGYLVHEDFPSTFGSLLPQHQSDLIRAAALVRYGGIYMDLSTVVYANFDLFWEELEHDDVAIHAYASLLPDTDLDIYNDAFLAAKSPNHPILAQWLERMKEYALNPALTNEQAFDHPFMTRMKPYMNHPGLGLVRDIVPYGMNLLMLTEIIWFNPQLQKHVIILPPHGYGFVNQQLQHFREQYLAEQRGETLEDFQLSDIDWSLFGFMYNTIQTLDISVDNMPHLTDAIAKKSTVLKFSASLIFEGYDNSTVMDLIRGGSDLGRYPSKKASSKGFKRAHHTETITKQ